MPVSGPIDGQQHEDETSSEQALRQRVRRLEEQLAEEVSLSDIQQRLLASPDVEQIAARLLDAAPELTACERCRLMVRSGDGWDCWDRQLGERVQHYHLGSEAGFPEEVVSGQGAAVRSPWFEGGRVELSARTKLRSYVALPVITPRHQVGIFEAANFVHPEEIDRHADLLGEMLTSAAAAIELAWLYSELSQRADEAELAARRIGALQEVTEVAISSFPLDGLLPELLGRIRKVLKGDTGTILLLSEDGRRLVVRASSGLDGAREGGTVPVDKGFVGRVAAARKPLFIENVSRQEVASRFLRERVRSLIGAPLTVEGRLIGVLHVGTVETRRFTEDDLRLMELVADRAALAIERTRVEEERERLLEQREGLLQMVSHDLRGPLTAVQGQAQLLQRMLEKSDQDGRLRTSADAILVSARRMNAMIQDLLDLARVESRQLALRRTRMELRSFVLDLEQRMEAVLDTGRIRAEIPEGLPEVWADPDRLERVLTNLLSNALKYSEEEVRVTAARDGDQVRVSVIDRGVGIPPEDREHLFERYYRAKGARKAEGLGLGLYISRMLVDAMGGRIWVETEVGKGSCFSFTLPSA